MKLKEKRIHNKRFKKLHEKRIIKEYLVNPKFLGKEVDIYGMDWDEVLFIMWMRLKELKSTEFADIFLRIAANELNKGEEFLYYMLNLDYGDSIRSIIGLVDKLVMEDGLEIIMSGDPEFENVKSEYENESGIPSNDWNIHGYDDETNSYMITLI